MGITANVIDVIEKDLADLGCRTFELYSSETTIQRVSFIRQKSQFGHRFRQVVVAGLSLASVVDRQVGYSSTTDFAPTSLNQLARVAVAGAQRQEKMKVGATPESGGDKRVEVFPSEGGEHEDMTSYSPEIASLACDDLVRLAEDLPTYRSLQTRDVGNQVLFGQLQAICQISRVFNSGGSSLVKGSSQIFVTIGTSLGSGEYLADYKVMNHMDVEGIEVCFSDLQGKLPDMSEPPGLAPARAKVVLSPAAVSTLVHEGFAPNLMPPPASSFDGKGELGKQVASPSITIKANDMAAPNFFKWDDHGCECRSVQPVSHGILEEYLTDHSTSSLLGLACTGNGSRGNLIPRYLGESPSPPFRQGSTVQPTNLVVTMESPVDDLLSDVREGVYISSVGPPFGRMGKLAFRGYGAWLIEHGNRTKRLMGVNLLFPDRRSILANVIASSKHIDGYRVLAPELAVDEVEIRSDVDPDPCSIPCTL